jgi:hypothetical protein
MILISPEEKEILLAGPNSFTPKQIRLIQSRSCSMRQVLYWLRQAARQL